MATSTIMPTSRPIVLKSMYESALCALITPVTTRAIAPASAAAALFTFSLIISPITTTNTTIAITSIPYPLTL